MASKFPNLVKDINARRFRKIEQNPRRRNKNTPRHSKLLKIKDKEKNV